MNRTRPVSGYTPATLVARLAHARARLRALMERLPPHAWLGPRAPHLNPPLWEYGHVVWFQERWCLRERADGRRPSLLPQADALYDSSTVPHDTRWDLPLLSPRDVDAYADAVSSAVAERLQTRFDDDIAYFAELSLYHELMHVEAWWIAFQALGHAPPPLPAARLLHRGDARLAFAADTVVLGSDADHGFIFDNEKWPHRVTVAAFDIDAQPVSETAYAEFVAAGGYAERTLWSAAGGAWRTAAAATHPLYWRADGHGWQVRRYDQWQPLRDDVAMLHVNRHEAEAYAAWQGRRLPTSVEWVHAAAEPGFQWGHAWEWMDDAFAPYPGFEPDPYRDYSQPWFHTHNELRGAAPVTDPGLARAGFRNFYTPERRDPFAGFRTARRVPFSLPSST